MRACQHAKCFTFIISSTPQNKDFFGGVAKKVAVQHKFVNFMYFTYEEAEIQILHKYPVVWLQKVLLQYIKLFDKSRPAAW